jgi:hypothetical protein
MDLFTLPFFASFNAKDQVSHPIQTTGKLRVCMFYCFYYQIAKKTKQKFLDRILAGIPRI